MKIKERFKKISTVFAGIVGGSFLIPSVAYADTGQAGAIVGNIASLLSQGIILAGSVMIVWGAVNVGMAVKDGSNGNQLQQGIMWIVGGVIVAAAGGYFLSISWSL